MGSEITKDIVTKIKDAISLTEDIDDTQLLEKLSKTLIYCHPDKVKDEEAKKTAEERFKQLNSLRQEFKTYLERKKVNTAVATVEDTQKSLAIVSIDRATDEELELIAKNKEIERLQWGIRFKTEEKDRLQKKFDEFIEQSAKQSKESLDDIYKPKKIDNALGLSAAIALLISFVPQVQTLTSSLGATGVLGTIIIYALTGYWVLSWVRTVLKNSYTHSIIDEILVGTNLMNELKIQISPDKYSKPYFTEDNVTSLVDKLMRKWYRIVVFFGNYNSMRRLLVEYVLLELEHKHIIISTKTSDMKKIFYIEHSDTSKDIDFLFN